MEDEILRAALAPGAECLSIEQLGRYADGTLGAEERTAAAMHIRRCLSCQAELALLEAVTSSGVRPEEAEIVRDGAARLEQRMAETPAADRVAPSSSRRWLGFGSFPVAAVAAVLLIGMATGSVYFLLIRQAPELPGGVITGDEVTRSLAVTVRGPVGDQVESPPRFEWLAVDRAVRYRVRLMEVDRQEVWSASASDTRSGPAAGRTSVDRSRENAALGRDGVRRGRRGNCRIGSPIFQARTKVIAMWRIKVWTALTCLFALGASAAGSGDEFQVARSGRDRASGQHRPDEGQAVRSHADLDPRQRRSTPMRGCLPLSKASGYSPRTAK